MHSFDSSEYRVCELTRIPVKKRIDYKILLYVYKCLNGKAPSYLTELIKIHHPSRSLRSSTSIQLVCPKSNMVTAGNRTFSFKGPALWNKLPKIVKEAKTIDNFKSELKTSLFSN